MGGVQPPLFFGAPGRAQSREEQLWITKFGASIIEPPLQDNPYFVF
jgi:hypothetical protein